MVSLKQVCQSGGLGLYYGYMSLTFSSRLLAGCRREGEVRFLQNVNLPLETEQSNSISS